MGKLSRRTGRVDLDRVERLAKILTGVLAPTAKLVIATARLLGEVAKLR